MNIYLQCVTYKQCVQYLKQGSKFSKVNAMESSFLDITTFEQNAKHIISRVGRKYDFIHLCTLRCKYPILKFLNINQILKFAHVKSSVQPLKVKCVLTTRKQSLESRHYYVIIAQPISPFLLSKRTAHMLKLSNHSGD